MPSHTHTKSAKSDDIEQLENKDAYLKAVYNFALTLIDITTVDDLLWHVAGEVVGRLDFVDCVIYLVDHERNVIVQRAAIGEKSPQKHVIINKLEIPIGTAIAGTVAQTREPIIVANTMDNKEYLKDIAENGSEICVPMLYEGEVIGVIDCEYPERNYFTRKHLELLTTIAAMTSAKIEQCRTLGRMRTQTKIIQQVSEAVVLIRYGGEIIHCNNGALALTGKSRQQLQKTNIRSLISEGIDSESLLHTIIDSIEQNELWKGRLPILHSGRGEVITEASVTELIDDNYEDKVFIAVLRDVTQQIEKERLQRELIQAQKMDSLGQLTGGIAHDFNNLLGIIGGYSDLALNYTSTNNDHNLTKYLTQIKDAVSRATNLVTQMLSFSRAEAIDKQPLDMGPLLKQGIAMIRATLPSTIELNLRVESDLPQVMLDSTQFDQLLMNLCINARDSIEGIGILTIRLAIEKDLDCVSPVSHKSVKGDWVALSVSDTGAGISKDSIARIFNPFYTTKDVGKGTGMGLSVVYKIMEGCQGHILVDSKTNVGSTFKLLFPPIHNPITQLESKVDAAEADVPASIGKHILVVDDEPGLASFICELLESTGYKTTPMIDSTQALECFETHAARFDLLITDQTMPKITGVELINHVLAIRPNFPVILCSGYSELINAKTAEEQQLPFFEKPVNVNLLLATVSKLLES